MKFSIDELETKVSLESRNIKETSPEKVLKVKFNDSVITEITFDKLKVKEQEDVKDIKILMLKGEKGDSGSSGDYDTLDHIPSIEGVELRGDKTFEELTLNSLTNAEIENLLTM